MDDTNFVDDVGADLYIYYVDEYDGESHGGGSNTPSDEAYGDMTTNERPEKDNIDNAAYEKYIGSELIMDVYGEGPRRETFIRRFEDLNGAKVGAHHWNQLMDNWEYKLEYDDRTHDCYFANVIAKKLHS